VKPELDVLPVGLGAPAGLAEAVVGDDPGRAGAPEGMSEGMSEGMLEGANEGGCVTVKLLVVMLLLSDVIYRHSAIHSNRQYGLIISLS
jgi:hypothetical protein